jgi:SAM-dependent methyltransferase
MDDSPDAQGGRPVDWLLRLPDVASRLRAEPPDLVLMLCCADGTAAIEIALEFPNTTVYGIDPDPNEVTRAVQAGQQSRARDRVLFLSGDVLRPRLPGGADVVIAVGLLTDPQRPDKPGLMTALAGIAGLLRPRGLAVLDVPVAVEQSTARAAGFASVEEIGDSPYGCPVYLFRG